MTRHKGKPDHQLESIVCREETCCTFDRRKIISFRGYQSCCFEYWLTRIFCPIQGEETNSTFVIKSRNDQIFHCSFAGSLYSKERVFFTTGGMKVTIVLICFLLATASPTGERSAKFSHSLPSHARYLTHLTTASGKKNLNR